MIHHTKLLLLVSILARTHTLDFVPCQEISQELRFPCTCALGPTEEALDGNPSLSINCDNIVFPTDVQFIPYGAPVVSFNQRYAGHQSLPSQVSILYLSK